MEHRAEITIDLTGDEPVNSIGMQTPPEYWKYSKEFLLALADSLDNGFNISHSKMAAEILKYYANKQE